MGLATTCLREKACAGCEICLFAAFFQQMARVGAVVWGFVSSVPLLLKLLLKLRYPRAQQGKGWWRETLLCSLLVLEILLALPQAPGGGKGGLFLFLRLALIPAEDLISCSPSSSALLQCRTPEPKVTKSSLKKIKSSGC